MNLKRFLAWLLAFVLCFTLVACKQSDDSEQAPTTQPTAQTQPSEEPTQTADPSQVGTATPLLYRVTDADGNTVWLFGSIHIGREDYYPLPQYIHNAFESADALAVEVDIIAFEKSLTQQLNAMKPLVYTDGTTIKDHIPQELYQQSVDILKAYNAYSSAMDMYCPSLWFSLIDTLMLVEMGGNVDLGIDRHLIQLASAQEKEILEVESAEFQYQMLADFDDDVQIMLLQTVVDSYEDKDAAAADLLEMMDLWASGDEEAFNLYLNESDDTLTEEEIPLYERYNQAMLIDRNLNMAAYAQEALSSGKEVFICVGAAHIVGEGALVDLLTQRGYTVECITA